MRSLFVLVMAVLSGGLGAAEPAAGQVRRTFQIDLSTKHTLKPQDWSGRAAIGKGRIVTVDKTSGASDTVHEDGSWTVVYGRSLNAQPNQKPREKALLITVESPDDATVTLTTRGGTFSFGADEVPDGHPVEALDGNVRISLLVQAGGNADPEVTGGGGRAANRLPPAKVAGVLPAQRVSDGAHQSEWPSLAVAADGGQWLAWVEWDGQARDRVLVARRPPQGGWGPPTALDDGGWDHYWPAVAAVGDRALVVWSSQLADGNVELFWATLGAEPAAAKPARLTNAPHTDFHARLVADAKGSAATLVWQSFRNGRSDIYARRWAAGRWADEVRLSPADAHDWQPDVALDSTGRAWVCWDGYERGNYDVFLRSLDATGPGPLVAVTAEPTAQFHSTVAVDRQDRVWVAWDDGGPNWGKDLSASSSAPGNRGLHASRTIGLRVVADGSLWDVAPAPATALTGAMAAYAELPQLAMDGTGTPWLVFRHWTTRQPMEMYDVYAMHLAAGGWAGPWRLADSSGRNTQWATLARLPSGALLAAYASDGRTPQNLPKDQVKALIYSVFAAELPAGPGLPEVKLSKVSPPAVDTRFVPRVRPTHEVDGKSYTLIVGDCHRHTDVRGHSGVDASVMDTFRYAMDPAQLDFLGLGDHNEVFGGRWPDGLRDYQWWWTQKAVDLYTCPPTFIGVYSYEHSMASPGGHRNILFLKRGAPLRMIDRGRTAAEAGDNQPPDFWKWVRENVLTQPGQTCVIVPHTFASGPLASWDWPNPEFDCLLEIYQGCRGSYEKIGLAPGEKRGGTQTKQPGHFAQDALDRGNVYGFVSFSDHRSTHNSWACVWVDQVSRASLFDALLARRTYAASDEIVVRLTVGGTRTVGQTLEATVDQPPAFSIDVEAPDEIRRVDVIRNGLFVWTKSPAARTFKAEFRDVNVTPGRAYYYVRVFQRDPEAPDGDPEIAWSSPVFVTYR